MSTLPISFDQRQIEQLFEFDDDHVVRRLIVDGRIHEARVENVSRGATPEKAFFISGLSRQIEYDESAGRKVRYADLFCGGGGLSLGVDQSLRLLGQKPKCVVAADLDKRALDLVSFHHRPNLSLNTFIDQLVSYQIDYTGKSDDFIVPPKISDDSLCSYSGKIDLLVGGPPCQGHSNFNNHTRGADPRNLLYFTMPAVAIALDIPNLIIENVQTISRASEQVVEITKKILRHRGYHVEEIILSADKYGVGQLRKRHFLVASTERNFDLHATAQSIETIPLTFSDINTGIPGLDFEIEFLTSNGNLSEVNNKRISYLHDNDEDNLPASERPDCHKGGHTYPSVYGRIRADEPMQTITTGFGSPGRGRFVHPHERRVITNREAARGQSFPDWYWNSEPVRNFDRGNFQKIIGDAVPANLVTPLIVSLFG